MSNTQDPMQMALEALVSIQEETMRGAWSESVDAQQALRKRWAAAWKDARAALQSAPQPQGDVRPLDVERNCPFCNETWVEQAAQASEPSAAKFKLGDTVCKTKGSQWRGAIVGNYSTALTPEGYAVESSTEKGSVQIYPAAALEAAPARASEPSECTRSHPHENMDGFCKLRTEIARLTNENARLKAAPARAVEPLLENMPTNWELSWGSDDEERPGEWQVHARQGSRNDREWVFLGSGPTPSAAIERAHGITAPAAKEQS